MSFLDRERQEMTQRLRPHAPMPERLRVRPASAITEEEVEVEARDQAFASLNAAGLPADEHDGLRAAFLDGWDARAVWMIEIPDNVIDTAIKGYGTILVTYGSGVPVAKRALECALRAAFEEMGLKEERRDRLVHDGKPHSLVKGLMVPEARYVTDWQPIREVER